MAVQAQQFGGLAGGCLPPLGGAGGLADEQLQALLLSSAATAGNNKAYWYQYQQHHHNSGAPGGVASAAQSELTCNGGVPAASRKRGRDGGALDDLEQYASSRTISHPHPPSSLLPPLPASAMQTQQHAAALQQLQTRAASTSGRAPSLAPELDAAVRAECERLRLGLAQACKRQREAVARAAAASAARALREAEAALDRARRRAAELEERLRQAAAESQAWCGLARSNEAAAAGLLATLDALLLRAAGAAPAAEQVVDVEEGFGESGSGHDDAASCCFVEENAEAGHGASAAARGWACRACGAGEATVLVLPCRHLSLCKACEPRADACPVCLAAKNASIHVAGAE